MHGLMRALRSLRTTGGLPPYTLPRRQRRGFGATEGRPGQNQWDAAAPEGLAERTHKVSRPKWELGGAQRKRKSWALGNWITSPAKLAPEHGAVEMASQRHTKKEGSLRDLFAKTPAKKAKPDEPLVIEGDAAKSQEVQGDGDAPLTRSFMEHLFGTLRGDFATLKQEIAAEVKEMKREDVELGLRSNTLEQVRDPGEEELDCHRRELLTLQDKNQELQYQIEDLENRSRRSNI
ncbi:hypothetical protein NDU88_003984 [Pleurodeles waltl]|uniref:Uncharacterized protein n=1 Tax=Pleurodeles waltl TaxID=8319 RepID=A0AAV7T808_PLEWA|nr:hypothetical protein NDU88_003984 [Pleurodeles waltl]